MHKRNIEGRKRRGSNQDDYSTEGKRKGKRVKVFTKWEGKMKRPKEVES